MLFCIIIVIYNYPQTEHLLSQRTVKPSIFQLIAIMMKFIWFQFALEFPICLIICKILRVYFNPASDDKRNIINFFKKCCFSLQLMTLSFYGRQNVDWKQLINISIATYKDFVLLEVLAAQQFLCYFVYKSFGPTLEISIEMICFIFVFFLYSLDFLFIL